MRAIFLDGDGTAFISEQRNRRAIERVAARGGFSIDSDTFWDIPGGDAGSGDERVWHMIVGKTFGFDAFRSTYPDTAAFQDAVDQEYLNS
ncbi:MAG TPA: hypothetical protein PLF01_05440, partial [Alphaproteobacteria bacterium]|nr:hypothetical protein [Alphaproteobacteria bacterium]